MRLAIDARMLGETPQNGIARYTFELLKNFSPDFKKSVFVFVRGKSCVRNFLDSSQLIEVRSKWLGVFEQLEVPYLLWKHKIDFFHSPSFFVPFLCHCPFFVTLHDLNHLVRKEDYGFLQKIYYSVFLKKALEKAFKIITVSHFSKSEIKRFYPEIPEEKIEVIHNGVTKVEVSGGELLQVKRDLNLPQKFCFALSNGKAHKNIERLIRVYKNLEVSFPLLVCGKLPDSFEEKGLKEKIIFIGFVSEKEFFALYRLCEFFVFPSLYEGFGLPPLEALSVGTRVLSSKATSMPEVLGTHVSYFDPSSDESLKRALKNLLEERRDEGSQKAARKHAKSFSWKLLSHEVEALYKKASQSAPQKAL